MTLHPYRTTCPIGRKMSESCPCQRHQEAMIECASCLAEWEERAAILEHGQGTGGSPERPTCASRTEAEAEATRQLREAVAAAESKQGRLF